MKTKRFARAAAIGLLSAGPLWAQSPVLSSFERPGEIAWTNEPVTGALYRVQWAASLDGPWKQTWQGLERIEGQTDTVFAARVPMFFRVAMDTSLPPAGMVLVDGGVFEMGDSYLEGFAHERPVHEVFVSAFYLDRYEVSNEKMRQVMQWAYDHVLVTATVASVENLEGDRRELLDLDDPQSQVGFSGGTFYVATGKENFPCVSVSWYGALAFCDYCSDLEGLERCVDLDDWTCDFTRRGYRLPTEAEWEKAARGGWQGHHYPWPSYGANYSNHIDGGTANYESSGDPFETGGYPWSSPRGFFNGAQTPAGLDMANGFGLYDMAGNVWEWCWDGYQSDWYDQPEASEDDTRGPAAAATYRVLRSGSWDGDAVRNLRCASRNGLEPALSFGYLGFRCARTR